MRRLIQPSFLSCLLLLAAAEILLRHTLSPLSVAAFQCGHHPDSGFQETPDGLVHLVPGPTRNFHAQVFSRVRPPGVLRIFTLGNSVEHWDAAASQILSNTYPARLGEALRPRGQEAESINLGVTGYGSLRNEVLLHKILGYQPSLIIFKLDTTNEGTDETTAERRKAYCSRRPQDWLWKSFLVQSGLRWKEDRLLGHTLPPRVLAWTANRPVKPGTPAVAASPFNETSRRAIDECLQLAREQGVPVLLITQAYVTRDASDQASLTNQGLDDFAAQRCGPGVTMLSLKQLLGPLPIADTFVDRVHLTRPTHQLVAQAIAERVASMKKFNK